MYAYIDSFRKFGKTNTDNQSIKIKRPYPGKETSFFRRFHDHTGPDSFGRAAYRPGPQKIPRAIPQRRRRSQRDLRGGMVSASSSVAPHFAISSAQVFAMRP